MKTQINKFKNILDQNNKTILFIKNNSYTLIFIFLLLFSLRILRPIFMQSATYDEGLKIGASYVQVKKKTLIYDSDNPPFFRYLFGIPLSFFKLDIPEPKLDRQSENPKYFRNHFAFGYRFLFYNKIPAQTLLVSTRLVSFIFYFACGIFLFFFFKKYFSYTAGIIAAILYFLCPNLAASAALSTNDIFAVIFSIAFFASIILFYKEINFKNSVLVGISLGLALCTKFTLMIFLPLLGFIFIMILIRKKAFLKELFLLYIIIFGITFIIFELNYLLIKPESILKMIKNLTNVLSTGMMAYAFGNYSREGFWYYYPSSFILKTPLPILALVIYSFYIFFKEKKYKNDILLILFVSILILSFAAMKSKLNLGLRYILPIYPMLYIFIPLTILNKEKVLKKYIPYIFFLLVISNVLIHPHYQSYFNLLIGKNENGYKYFVDSTLDWGQDLTYLADYLKKESNPELILSYFGTSNPQYYGIKYQNLACNGLDHSEEENLHKHINSDNPNKEYLAVSATNLVSLNYPDRTWFKFLENYKPKKVIGNSIFVYEITNNIDIYKNIAKIYSDNSIIDNFIRCGRTVSFLNAGDNFGKLCQAISLLYYYKNVEKAESIFNNINLMSISDSKYQELLLKSSTLYTALLIKLEKYDLAINHLNNLTNYTTKEFKFRIHHYLAISYMRNNNYKLAEDNFKYAIKLNPNYFVAYFNLGVLYEKQNNPGMAEQMYRTALKINPRYVPAIMKLNGINVAGEEQDG